MTREDAAEISEPLFRDAYETGLRGEPMNFSCPEEGFKKKFQELSGHEPDGEMTKFAAAVARGLRRMYDYGREDAEKEALE